LSNLQVNNTPESRVQRTKNIFRLSHRQTYSHDQSHSDRWRFKAWFQCRTVHIISTRSV